MKDRAIDISIIIPCRNEEKHIKETVRGVVNQKGAGDLFSYEVLIVDGKSTDKTVEIIKNEIMKNSDIKLIINERKTTPAAFNLGIKEASGRFICIIGAHAQVSHDYLFNCLQIMNERQADNAGGPWRAKGKSYIGEAIALVFQNPFAVGGAKSHALAYEGYVDSVWGGFYKKNVFEKIGLFDEDLIRNQDDEFNYRLIKSGGKIWQSPKIQFYYLCRSNLNFLFLQYFQYGYWKIRVIQKHKLPASLRHIVPISFILTILGTVLFGLVHPFGFYLLGIIVVLYLLLVVVNSVVIALKNGAKYFPMLPFIFMAMHFGYGFGSLKGVWDFAVLRKHKKPGIEDQVLTR